MSRPSRKPNGLRHLAAALVGAAVLVPGISRAAETLVCLASDTQTASGESILCRRDEETFYARLADLESQGWKIKFHGWVRKEQAHAYYLERELAAAPPSPPK